MPLVVYSSRNMKKKKKKKLTPEARSDKYLTRSRDASFDKINDRAIKAENKRAIAKDTLKDFLKSEKEIIAAKKARLLKTRIDK